MSGDKHFNEQNERNKFKIYFEIIMMNIINAALNEFI